jgi:excisionase family DNA binding protein
VGIDTAIRTVEEFVNQAKNARKAQEPPARASQLPERDSHEAGRGSQLDSGDRRLVRQEVRAAVNEVLAPVLEQVRTGAATDVAYLSVERAAAVAEVHPDTIRAWVKAGRLPEHRAGRELRIRRDELHRFLDRVGDGDVRPTVEDEAAMILARRRRG